MRVCQRQVDWNCRTGQWQTSWQGRTLTDDLAGVDIAGLDNGGLDIDGLDNGGLDIDGLDIAGLDIDGRLWTINYNILTQ